MKMKCSKCQKSWIPIAEISLNTCPGCTEPHAALKALVEGKGEDLIGTHSLYGYLKDLLPAIEIKYHKIIKTVIDENIDVRLLSIVKNKGNDLEINHLINTFKRNNGFDESADYIFNCFLYAFGYIDEINIKRNWKILVKNLNENQVKRKNDILISSDIITTKNGGELTFKTTNSLYKRLFNQKLKVYDFNDFILNYIDVLGISLGLLLGVFWSWAYAITAIGFIFLILRIVKIFIDCNHQNLNALKFILNEYPGSGIIVLGSILLLFGTLSSIFLILSFFLMFIGIFFRGSELDFEKTKRIIKNQNYV